VLAAGNLVVDGIQGKAYQNYYKKLYSSRRFAKA